MGFLKWLADNPEESEESQLTLFGNSQPLTKQQRLDSAIVNRDFNQVIEQKGGSDRAYPKAANAMTQELFDMNARDLYEATDGKLNDRSTLPKSAQKAFTATEIRAGYELEAKDIQGSQRQKDQQIVESVRQSSKANRKWLPW